MSCAGLFTGIPLLTTQYAGTCGGPAPPPKRRRRLRDERSNGNSTRRSWWHRLVGEICQFGDAFCFFEHPQPKTQTEFPQTQLMETNWATEEITDDERMEIIGWGWVVSKDAYQWRNLRPFAQLRNIVNSSCAHGIQRFPSWNISAAISGSLIRAFPGKFRKCLGPSYSPIHPHNKCVTWHSGISEIFWTKTLQHSFSIIFSTGLLRHSCKSATRGDHGLAWELPVRCSPLLSFSLILLWIHVMGEKPTSPCLTVWVDLIGRILIGQVPIFLGQLGNLVLKRIITI